MSLFDDLAVKTEEDEAISELINRKRRLLTIHSIIYYEYDDNIWPDSKYDAVGKELAELQKQHGAKHGYKDELFESWDGQSMTGFHLAKAATHEERMKALWLLRERMVYPS